MHSLKLNLDICTLQFESNRFFRCLIDSFENKVCDSWRKRAKHSLIPSSVKIAAFLFSIRDHVTSSAYLLENKLLEDIIFGSRTLWLTSFTVFDTVQSK